MNHIFNLIALVYPAYLLIIKDLHHINSIVQPKMAIPHPEIFSFKLPKDSFGKWQSPAKRHKENITFGKCIEKSWSSGFS